MNQNMSKQNEGIGNHPTEPYILFELAGATYGIHSTYVQQMEMLENVTPVPNTPGYVDGVMFSRGQVIPVINLRERLGFERIAYDLRTRVIVVRHDERIAGLVVDSSREYLNLATSTIQPTPEFITGISGPYLGGVSKTEKRVILIFNVEGILTGATNEEIIKQNTED